jgi:hypothetical protein
MSESHLTAWFILTAVGSFWAGVLFGALCPRTAETLRAYTANEEPRDE